MNDKKDVFVSYSASDLGWVDGELLRRLKDARVQYIEPRDFRPGTMRIKEIEKAIALSRRTLLIVTPSFLEDSWQEFETGVAFAFALDNRTWSVIPVIKEKDIDLPLRLRGVVPRNLTAASEQDWQDFTNILSSDPPSETKPPPPPPPPKEHAASSGLALLVELMSNSDISVAVSEFRADFEDLCVQMVVLDRLKKLHDRFQELESTHNVLFHYARLESEGLLAWDQLEILGIDLSSKAQELIDYACESSLAGPDDLWVQRLSRAVLELDQAVEKRTVDKLRISNRRLSAVFDSLPARLNVRMVTEARALRLGALVRALMTVHQILKGLKSTETTNGHLVRIEESATRIAEMDQALRAVLYVHDSLQEIDTELRRVEVFLDDDVLLVVELWDDLKPKMQGLSGNNNDWAIGLASAGAELEKSLPVGDRLGPDVLRKKFRLYRGQVTRTFNRVDRDMLRKCNELEAEIRKPLAPLLALLQAKQL